MGDRQPPTDVVRWNWMIRGTGGIVSMMEIAEESDMECNPNNIADLSILINRLYLLKTRLNAKLD